MITGNDKRIIRELASRVAEIAALPVQEEKRRLWRGLNGLQPQRPMVMIDQVCWNEMDAPDELGLKCVGAELREYEERFRRTLYQWEHFPADMVVEATLLVDKAVSGIDLGIEIQEDTAPMDPTNEVVSHEYKNQFQTDDDLERIRAPRIEHDPAETERRLAVAHELFYGVLEVRPWGVDPYLSLWDPIATWMGVEDALYALIDKPDYMHRLLTRMTDGYLCMLDQLEELGLLCEPQGLIHCTGAYTDDLPAPDYNPQSPRTKDIWMYGLAQMFSSVSPEMFREFEVEYTSRMCERFGLVYYGCCDPLDGKMTEVRMIPNVRKISMSPWVNEERGAQEIAGDYVYSRKPNPAFLAMDTFDAHLVRTDLTATREVCERHGCPLEYILKDISTVRYRPERISEWAGIAMEVVER